MLSIYAVQLGNTLDPARWTQDDGWEGGFYPWGMPQRGDPFSRGVSFAAAVLSGCVGVDKALVNA
jgi:hypothetical protein